MFYIVDLLEGCICEGSYAPADTQATGIIEGLRSKSASLVKQTMEDRLLHKLAYLALTYYTAEPAVLERFVAFLRAIF